MYLIICATHNKYNSPLDKSSYPFYTLYGHYASMEQAELEKNLLEKLYDYKITDRDSFTKYKFYIIEFNEPE